MNGLELFTGLSDSTVDWILANAAARTDIANTTVVREGDTPDAIHLVSSGLYAAESTSIDGVPIELGRLCAGSVFGEMAWLTHAQGASATVRAVETSERLVLPLALLERRIGTDPAFAAEIMRALARLMALRVQAMNLAARRQSARSDASDAGDASLTALTAAVTDFKVLAARIDREARTDPGAHGVHVHQMKLCLRSVFDTLDQCSRAIPADNFTAAQQLGARARIEVLPYILATSTLERFYSKPRGYAGDFLSIEHIYDHRHGGTTAIGRVLDEAADAFEACEAVRNRRGLLREQIIAVAARHPAPVRVMSLACGPAREVSDALHALPAERRPRFTLLDIDTEALALVRARLETEGWSDHATLLQGNLIRLATGRERIDAPPQHLVYSIGLIDYFNDDFVIRLLNWIHERLEPGGRVILGNFHVGNRLRAFMDHVLEWRLIHRSEEDMQRLFAATPFGRCSDILFEQAGVQLFAVGERAS